jgi:hypothetical protein
VHDSRRPQPQVVTPGSAAAEQVGTAPSDATALFDGGDLSKWKSAKDGAAQWQVENGHVQVNGTGDIETVEHFSDCQVHLEWSAPAEVKGDSQGRGNSGVFLLGLYEIQVLDGYNNPTYADGITGAIYGQFPPLVNACRPPGEWQSYDIIFEAPKWVGKRLHKPASLTLLHNGVLIHHCRPALGPTDHKAAASYKETSAESGPLRLQDHGDAVRYRNIWIRPLTGYDASG